jgi:hypothetical protein
MNNLLVVSVFASIRCIVDYLTGDGEKDYFGRQALNVDNSSKRYMFYLMCNYYVIACWNSAGHYGNGSLLCKETECETALNQEG